LELTYFELLAVALRRLVRERLFYKKLLFYEGTSVSSLRMRPFWPAPLVPSKKNFLKQDQFGILAQFFSSCGNLRLENFTNAIFIARLCPAVKCRVGNCRANDANHNASCSDTRLGCPVLRVWNDL
jgi:hypothetical protein